MWTKVQYSQTLGSTRVLHLDRSDLDLEENKGKKGKSKDKDDDCVTIATGNFGVLKMDNYGVTKTKALVAKENVNAIDIEASLWHRRLTHISKKWLNCLAKKYILPGLKNAELEKRSHCMAGKHTRVSFKKHPPSRKSELLELVHSDVCVPLKKKDQVLEKLKQFQSLVERQSGKKVKCIRSDNYGEYCGPFDVYCKQQGVPKDERSKLDMKTRQCIFIRYGHDEYDYRMYDPVEKKLVRSRDVQFMEDETIEDIYKNGEQHNYVGGQQLGDGFDVSLNDDAKKEHEMSQDENLAEPPPIYLRRSNRQRKSSTRSKHIDVRYHWIHDALDAKLVELANVYTNDNGVDIMTKVVPRGNFEACCEIVGLAITST
ncbi:hypothetical protein CR513_51470, partial [Mucuna pruriens]